MHYWRRDEVQVHLLLNALRSTRQRNQPVRHPRPQEPTVRENGATPRQPGNGEKPPRNFDKARERARKAANEAVGDELDRIVAGTDELQQVFEALKLKDEASYEQLTGIVRDAASRVAG